MGFLGDAFDGAVDVVKDVSGDVLDAGEKVVDVVTDGADAIVDVASDGVNFAGDVASTVGRNVVGGASSVLTSVMSSGRGSVSPGSFAGAKAAGSISKGAVMSSGAIAPCAFQLDVQWILDIIDKVQSVITKIQQVASNVLGKARRMLDSLGGILSWFCWIGPVKWAKDFVTRMCALVEKAISIIAKIYNAVLEVSKHVLAPWEVRSAGEQIRDDLAPKCADFAAMLHPGNLKSSSSWTGESAEKFRSSLQRQFDTGQDVADAAKEFGSTVQGIGADGVKTTVVFATSLITAIGGIITAAVAMAAIPVGTAAGAAAVIKLVGAVLAMIMVYVKAMMGIIQQSSALGNAASSVPGGQWPMATS